MAWWELHSNGNQLHVKIQWTITVACRTVIIIYTYIYIDIGLPKKKGFGALATKQQTLSSVEIISCRRKTSPRDLRSCKGPGP